MKQFYILLVTLLISTTALAQIPTNYYDSADGLTGFALKTELRNITATGHQSRTYDQLYDGNGITTPFMSNGYEDTHSDISVSSGNNYENDGSVLDMYSENPSDDDNNPLSATGNNDPYNFSHGIAQCGNQSSEGDCYNREHIIPQSSFGSSYPMQSDIHHVIPTDGRVNNFRGNLPFGNVATANFTSLNGSKRGSSAMPGYSGTVFEPIDEFKGDIARAILYFATRYQNTVDGYTSFDMFNGTNDQVFYPWAIDVLLDWHNNIDPVDQRERDRNNAAYKFQVNANPFVDHPEYANLIWNPVPDTEAPEDILDLLASNPTDNSIELSWSIPNDNIAVTSYDIYLDAVYAFNTTTNSFTVSGLTPNTLYCFTVKAKDAANNESGFSNESCETTTNNGSTGGTSDLFFSEYIEGSGNNKALEIANFTGATVNLSAYTIKKSVNGANSWDTTIYSFPTNAQITNGDVYVAANSAIAICQTSVDDLTGSSVFQFNGDDPLGLFKNDVLIDIIGTLGSDTDFAINTTLIRNETVSAPNTTYTVSEWTSFTSNTCDNLGLHTQTLSIPQHEFSSFRAYPNPVKNILHIDLNTSKTTSIEIYNILGKKVISQVIQDSGNINTQKLSPGIYILKITQGNTSISKKLLKQ